jgi:hypothetical protein
MSAFVIERELMIASLAGLPAPFLLVGEAPNELTRHLPEYWCTFQRMATVLGPQKFYGIFHRTNLMLEPQPKIGANAQFKVDWMVRARAESLAEHCRASGMQLVLAGKRVASAFNPRLAGTIEEPSASKLPWFEPLDVPCAGGVKPIKARIIPHPSGANRWWNEEDNRRRGEEFLRSLATEYEEWSGRR